ncbi:MFS transporter [Salipaludibacillus agaradhaerens]|uniref:MFS transporter n=1 Tax=Salipaludibacillus agaradhaerens TaxID=76935 RepID=A0A9Q4B4G9_SALAG|nr:MFS transporter [Salipaludibacillus agaradhaerens]MCR6098173.1 MFS transporter [Salipaludibacillus agaradhaerens]MCR6116197.1 MFS transporter [Salipaludibacillus agaradhaerens]
MNNKPLIALLFTLYFFYFFILDALEIIIPLYLKDFGISAMYIGLIFSLANLIRFFSSIGFALKDFQIRTSLLFVFIAILSTLTVYYFVSIPIILFTFAVLLFSTRSLFNITLNPVLLYSVESKNRGKIMGVRDVFLYSGSAIGVMTAGALANYSFHFLFGLFIVISLAMIFIVYKIKPEKSEKNKSDAKHMTRFSTYKNPVLIKFCILGLVCSISGGGYFLIPLIGQSHGYELENILFTFAASTVIAAIFSFVGGQITDRFNKKGLLIIAQTVSVLIAFMIVFSDFLFIYYAAVLSMSLEYLFAPVFPVFFAAHFNETDGKVYWKAMIPFLLLGELISPVMWGFLWDTPLHNNVFIIIAILNILSIVLVCIMFKTYTKIPREESLKD